MSEPHDVRGHFPYHHYAHPTDHSHDRPVCCCVIDAQSLGMAMDLVGMADDVIGVVGRGSFAERVAAEYARHGLCDYNGGPGSDQCPHGVFYAARVVAEYNACPWHGTGTLPSCTCPAEQA